MSDDLTDFTGVVRLFPLPNLVLFPHVMQPLHIFEPRYRQMTRDALASDRLIAMVLLKPGWEDDYEVGPAIHTIACLGRITAEQALEDGRFNLLLRGLRRIEIVEEIPSDKLYRSARVRLLEDALCGEAAEDDLREQLQALPAVWFSAQPQVLEHFDQLFEGETPLTALVDILAFALPLPIELKQQLLGELNVVARVHRLLHEAQQKSPAGDDRRFPPKFSAN